MAQLDPSRYRRITAPLTYGQSDGLYWDTTNSRLVVAVADTVYEAPLHIASQADGDIARRGSSAWLRAAPSGDMTIAAGGAVTIADPTKMRSTTVALTPTTIVGNAAGDIGHADGVELVAGVAGKIICIDSIVLNYTRSTADYTDGGNIYAIYVGGAAATGVCSAANSLGAAASNINVLRPLSGLGLVNTAVALVSAAAFTQPGGAAGTASVTTYYHLIDD